MRSHHAHITKSTEAKVLISYMQDSRSFSWYLTEAYNVWTKAVENASIQRRALVYQERMLAPRVLHFGRYQLFWVCCESLACESDSMGEGFFLYDSTKLEFCNTFLCNPESRYHHTEWRNIIEFYTGTVSTKPQDRLIALSGMAKLFASATDWTYVTDLWREQLASQLAWSVWYTKRKKNRHPDISVPYRALSRS